MGIGISRVQLDGSNNAFSPVVHGDIAPSINLEYKAVNKGNSSSML